MDTLLPDLPAGQLLLVIAPARLGRELMLRLAARLAARGPVQVIDGGNSFDAYRLARAIRRQTHAVGAALERLQVARAFTCYQMAALLAHAPAGTNPTLVFDLTATFYDESARPAESLRLLQVCMRHLHRLNRTARVVVSACPSASEQGRRPELLALLSEITENVLVLEPPQTQQPPRLF